MKKKNPEALTAPEDVKKAASNAGNTVDAAPDSKNASRKPSWLRLTVVILFALLYAYSLFDAISNTFGVSAQITKYNEYATQIGVNTAAIPWAVLVANMLLPIVVFGLAILVTRKRNIGVMAIVLLTGLAVVAAVSLSFTVLAGMLS